MGDFAGAVLKYLRRHPVPRLTIAGGIGKLAKLADGHLDLHSGRSQVDPAFLADAGPRRPAGRPSWSRGSRRPTPRWTRCSSARPPGCRWATWSRPAPGETALGVLRGAPVEVDVVVIDRAGDDRGRAVRSGRRPDLVTAEHGLRAARSGVRRSRAVE